MLKISTILIALALLINDAIKKRSKKRHEQSFLYRI